MNSGKIVGMSADQELVERKPRGQVKKQLGSAFYRGEDCNFNPYKEDFEKPGFLETFVLKGWLPASPPIDTSTRITAFGSCFAQHITQYLGSVGYDLSAGRESDIYISRMGEGLVNVHALLQQFEWALEGVDPPANLWHGYEAEEYGLDEDVRARTREVFLGTEFFIITLGLSEVWYDSETNGVMWRAVPMDRYDETRHKFRVCSFAESKATIARIHELIRKHVPAAKLLFTLSPVPLAATFRPVGCLTANAASKAILRAALDEFLREHGDELNETLFYFPSYEIVSALFPDPFEWDNRHPHEYVIKLIMNCFEASFCQSGADFRQVDGLFREIRDRNLDGLLLPLGKPRKKPLLQRLMRRIRGRGRKA